MNSAGQPLHEYASVAILRPGRFTALDGRRVDFSAETLRRIAANYEPAWQLATVNLDHSHSGPAMGHVAALGYDGEYLRADIRGVPDALAGDVARGLYPFRSAEIYADLENRGPYLRGLALLGARAPAVKGLPAMPAGSTQQKNTENRQSSSAGPLPRRKGNVLSIKSEVVMTTQSNSDDASRADPVLLAEENSRLADENRTLKQAERRRCIAMFLSGLRDSGQLTPAIEQCGVEDALLAAEDSALVVQLADGTSQPLSDVLRSLLEALPVSISLGERAFASAPPEAGLSEEELQIARQLGLSEEELLSIKAAN